MRLSVFTHPYCCTQRNLLCVSPSLHEVLTTHRSRHDAVIAFNWPHWHNLIVPTTWARQEIREVGSSQFSSHVRMEVAAGSIRSLNVLQRDDQLNRTADDGRVPIVARTILFLLAVFVNARLQPERGRKSLLQGSEQNHLMSPFHKIL